MQRCLFVFLAVIFMFAGLAQAQSSPSIPIRWYEPKTKPSKKAAGLNIVALYGRTRPNVQVQIDPDQIIVIQRNDANNKKRPRVAKKRVRSNSKGKFKFLLYMPAGLSQVPIVFRDRKGNESPILLTMRVNRRDVSLNVKVKRKTKVVTLIQQLPTRYSFAAGWSPTMFQQKLDTGTNKNESVSEFVPLSLRAEALVKYSSWWFVSHYQFATGGDYDLQSMLLGGRYKLSGKKNGTSEWWFNLDVDGRFLSLAVNDINEDSTSVNMQVFRGGPGVTYVYKPGKNTYMGTLYYREPFSLKVDSGELVYESQLVAGIKGEMEIPYKTWSLMLETNVEYSSFDYEFNNTPANISNAGSGTTLFAEFMVKAQFSLEKQPRAKRSKRR